ncbi:protein ATP1B4 isoform X2 [Alligator sinensis]|uniref:Sodium/potassium-transporting ATPase subunit beta n=1 Tax=Alligator sinensis TaxID=38654 RepID=A0A3Q0H1V7_ALLSI|nr:protein ATP1B4 isoform X2 [Alligator sinensis]
MDMNATSRGAEGQPGSPHQKPENKQEQQMQNSGREGREEVMAKKTWADVIQEMKNFLWDPENRTCLGRTAKSWGVMIRPYIHGFTIAFNVSEPSSWLPYVDSMHRFLTAYNDTIQEEKNIECIAGQYFIQEGDESEQKRACQFKRSLLQNCSGIEDPTFGYSRGQPCILLKMNRIIGYQAGAGTPVSVDCRVQKGNVSDLKSVDFYPESGTFDLMYYPYYGKHTHVNYTSPLVAMHFTDVRKNYFVPIQCKLNGKGIVNDVHNDRFLGRIVFTFNIGM